MLSVASVASRSAPVLLLTTEALATEVIPLLPIIYWLGKTIYSPPAKNWVYKESALYVSDILLVSYVFIWNSISTPTGLLFLMTNNFAPLRILAFVLDKLASVINPSVLSTDWTMSNISS